MGLWSAFFVFWDLLLIGCLIPWGVSRVVCTGNKRSSAEVDNKIGGDEMECCVVMDVVERLHNLIGPTIDGLGYELVRVAIQGTRRQTVQVMIERKDGVSLSVDDCTVVSRALSALMDVHDPVPGAYNLEVSSPGIDRPLTRKKDYEAWTGFDAKVETKVAIEGRRRFAGLLDGCDANGILRLLCEEGVVLIALEDVSKAKLVLTDRLIAHVSHQDAVC